MQGTEEYIAQGAGLAFALAFLAVIIGLLILTVVVVWRITSKTGYPGVLGLLYFVPIANLVFVLVLAFSEWPIERELRALKEYQAQPRT